MDICTTVVPIYHEKDPGHWVACHLYPGSTPDQENSSAVA
jgi:hypothetical protein